MRVVVLGGTGFVGRAVTRDLAVAGHDPVVVHRGETEVVGDRFPHIHGSRPDFGTIWQDIAAMSPDAFVDVAPYSRADAQQVLRVVPQEVPLIALSSMDVYRASVALRGGSSPDAMPLDESAPLRDSRYIDRDEANPSDDYEKLDVEEEYLERDATILRLPMIYGEHDHSRREEFILRRCRAGRDAIPIGSGSLLCSRGYVGDIARAVRLAVEAGGSGETFNICEARTWTIGQWARQIAQAAGWRGEFVRVPDETLPDDLRLTSSFEQHLLCDASKARRELGWTDTDPETTVQRSVDWHLSHAPEASDDFSADDDALQLAM
jgi:nucleoside-diphosphate-sugar epimerase